jgi:hypothetical protein
MPPLVRSWADTTSCFRRTTMRRIGFWALALLPAVTAGCTQDPLASARLAHSDGPTISTDMQGYLLRRDGLGLATEIGIRFENVSAERMYIVNCLGGLAPMLEKRVGDAWVPYWSPVLLQCLSAPIVVEPGQAIERRIDVWGSLPETNHYPQWATSDVEGIYRIVLHSVVFNYDSGRPDLGDPVPQELRVSNTFTLQR